VKLRLPLLLISRRLEWLDPSEVAELLQGSFAAEVLSAHRVGVGGAATADRVVAGASGRTASLYLRRDKHRSDPLLSALALRAATTVGVPLAHVEPAVLTRYSAGQSYGFHHDSGYVNRTHTLLCYLQTLPIDRGGETVFVDRDRHPDVQLAQACSSASARWSDSVRVRPVAGLAVFWRNLDHAGKPDPAAVHGSCVVEGGGQTKWILQFWISSTPVNFWPASLEAVTPV
jgi:hypothetical protein